MATMRLVPSTYALSNSDYLTISDASNMYTNTDSTTYATVTHTRASTNSTYYLYIRGFNFGSIPSNAEVSGFTVKIKASATGHTTSTSSSYYMSLINNTTQIGSTSASGRLSTTVTTFTFANGSLTWNTIFGYGANFGIRVPLRRASSNTADVVHVYGAEIEVTYTVPNPRTVTTTLTGDGTIVPSGTTTTYDDEEFELTITPTNKSDTVTATKDGVDITSELVAHGGTVSTVETNLGTYALVSGGFNGSGSTYFSGLVGAGIDHTKTTSNYYSSGSGTIAVFTYDMAFTNIPGNATIERVYCEVNGHAESTSQSSEYMCVQLISGSTNLTEEINFKSIGTSNTTVTLECEDLPTVSQLASMKLHCRLGYYGGAINGATCYVQYSVSSGSADYYTYTYTVSGDSVISVVIGNPTPQIVNVTGVSLDKDTASIGVGETVTLTETITPSNATDKSVSWSTSNSSVATVSNGVVTGVAQGTARITVTTTDGGYTDYCDVTVTPIVTYTYKQASTMQPGKNYLIANGNTGSVYLMTNESGGSRQLEGVSVTVTNGKITINSSIKATAEFQCSLYDSNNTITTCIVSDGKYLYSDNSSGLRFETTSSLNRFWHYNGTKFWQFKSTTSDGYTDTSTEYKYYLTVSNGNFTDNHVTSPSIEDSDLPAIYLFTEDTGDTDTLYFKNNGSWIEVITAYKKINGTWQIQSDLSNVFQQGVNYKQG